MHPYKKQVVATHKAKLNTATEDQPKGCPDIRETFRLEEHPSTDRLREAQSLPLRHDDKMPKAMAKSKYGDI